ncbi:hypothetical protein CLAFUW4_11998 [Fulvia fulva]|uniref:Uncharacterized protein n=1 Tax=Passalora fulva TaxID=5499 RepID=A0A9Q8USX0_PASFU|nr:uncharacterized protein CLAFUR5_11038 [Fulvia fulva]KAK4617886.1 hypothetical protein CLAFUR4_12003 [Fulvia fulva]KAK4618679.1 hypothetical protein CLAFUR0_12014 [Fulvia fulva]UJO21294.1 hypothetical protein CLAFUR5_11038 [Fulvia fulva]WPV17872.1 hypothetical protein CLAFUW4_11998 [Fulvia fulva]WPV33483.1 hypothetical protein CLAFUW7_12005 [Fulvia fulva]
MAASQSDTNPSAQPKSAAMDHPPATDGAKADSKASVLTLPRELRDIIYEYTFSGHEYSIHDKKRDHTTGLLRACQQLRAESITTYYKLTRFRCD